MSNKQINAILKAVERDLEQHGTVTTRTKNRMKKILKECECHEEPVAPEPVVLEGTGMISDAISAVKTKVNNYVDNALNTRPGQVDKLLKMHGDTPVQMITILRKPIQSAVKKFINFVSGGQLERAQKELRYDDIFHLYVNFTLNNGKVVGIEKNARVNTNLNGFPTAGLAMSNMLQLPGKNIPLRQFIEGGEKSQGVNFYRYNSSSYNCQAFVNGMMNAAGIEGAKDFVMQDASKLINSAGLSKTAKVVTDIAALAERAVKGHGRARKSRIKY